MSRNIAVPYVIFLGPLDPFVYENIFVNVGSPVPWNSVSNSVTIPTAGTYFIDVTGVMCGLATGCGGDSNLEIQVRH